MDKIHKPSNSESRTPSSEPFQLNLFFLFSVVTRPAVMHMHKMRQGREADH
jgi:hypothetical protein